MPSNCIQQSFSALPLYVVRMRKEVKMVALHDSFEGVLILEVKELESQHNLRCSARVNTNNRC